jgi:phage-related protein
MTGTEAVELLPAAAWIQAVFVCLFFVVVVYMLSWNSKQGKESRDFQQSESNKWQSFVNELNENWRKQNSDQRKENNCAMADVNAGLTNLTKVTEGLVMEVREMRTESRQITASLAAHDDQAKEILHIVQKPTRSRPNKDSQPQ